MSSNLFSNALEKIVSNAEIIKNPSHEELRKMAKKDEVTTEFGSASYVTKTRSRSAKFTEIIEEKPNEKQSETLQKVVDYLKGKKLLQVDRLIGNHPDKALLARLYITPNYARIALLWQETLFPPTISKEKSDVTMLSIPEWPEINVLVDSKSHTTVGLGSDYTGEVKMASLRMALYYAKQQGGLGLHAGSKCLYLKEKDGEIHKKGILLFGLSATGKTTLTCHSHWLDERIGERAVIRQDDIVFLWPDAHCTGSERNFYIKTEGMTAESQPILYKTLIREDALLENVMVKEGKIDFLNTDLTKNGRAIVSREHMEQTDDSIDLEKVDVAVFITRRKCVVPPMAKLTPEQAAAFFMLGESIETSAGDPTQAGKSIRVVGTNPFVVGPKHEEGNRFYEFAANNKIDCYLLNTGRFGASKDSKGEKIGVKDSATLISEAARGSIKWEKDPFWGYLVPSKVEGIDLSRFDWKKYYSEEEHLELNNNLKKERKEWLSKFPGLKKEIVDSVV